MATTRSLYQLAAVIAGTTRQLGPIGNNGFYSTVAIIPVLTTSLLPAVRRFVPEVTTNADAVVPAPGASFVNGDAGWSTSASYPYVPFADQATVVGAQSIGLAVQTYADAALTAGQLTFTLILFINGAEYGRVTYQNPILQANEVFSAGGNINFPNGYVIPAGAVIQTAVFVSGSNLSPTTPLNIRMATNGGVLHLGTLTVSIQASRAPAESQPALPTPASRAIVVQRVAPDAVSVTETASRFVIKTRTTREYFQPTDSPITTPTKRIAGTVYLRADGSRYLGGATVTLVRDSDGLEVATTTSSTVDGSYSFVRDAFDLNTYTTRIKRELVAGMIEEAVSQNGLAPV